jgi:murein DD-endopeptidase MepM/ murein hydrolase activator NlpD
MLKVNFLACKINLFTLDLPDITKKTETSPLFRNRKYILDLTDLQYKQVRLPWTKKLFRFSLWVVLSLAVSLLYFRIFESQFGSPKVKLLEQQIDNIKLSYSLLDRKLGNATASLRDLQQSDDIRYRPILNMDTLPSVYRNPGYGGVDRYRGFAGLMNASLIITSHQRLDAIQNMIKVQEESFDEIAGRRDEWIDELEHVPWICPVDISIPRGDGLKLREVHPVLGTTRWHFGQDFSCPYGTEVYATGNGKVIVAGWSSNGFGYNVIIDHGFGFQSIYGHLSKIEVPVGMNVKRGDIIGLSGNSGTSSGPHLHYQVDRYGNHENPLHFFSDDLSQEEYLKMITVLSSKSKFR